ncbi:MAG: hypothetical protein ACJAZD_003344 [Ilumatobacter sp.]
MVAQVSARAGADPAQHLGPDEAWWQPRRHGAGQSPNSERAVVKQQLSGGSVLEVKMTDLGSFASTNGVVLVSLIVTPYF